MILAVDAELSGLGWVCFQCSREGATSVHDPVALGPPSAPAKALGDRDPLHTSLPKLKGISDSKIILDSPLPLSSLFFLSLSPMRHNINYCS